MMLPPYEYRHQGFEALSDRIFFYMPSECAEGELVILCTWLGALPKHIKNYTQLYQQIASKASILLIESDVFGFTSSYASQRGAVEPAVRILLETLNSGQNLRIMLHVFSNGGANCATQLLRATRQIYLVPIPILGLILDSGPSKLTYWTTTKAVVSGLPGNPLLRALGGMFVHGTMIFIQTQMLIFGHESPADYQRRTLLDNSIIRPSRFTYIFSKADDMCLWTHVTAHANDARRLGFQVKEILFDGSSHCNHFLRDPEKYKAAVFIMWTDDPEAKLGNQESCERARTQEGYKAKVKAKL